MGHEGSKGNLAAEGTGGNWKKYGKKAIARGEYSRCGYDGMGGKNGLAGGIERGEICLIFSDQVKKRRKPRY